MSQPESITLTVDEANDGGTTVDVDYTYENLTRYPYRSNYIHSTQHAVDSRDQLNFYSTEPKAVGNFKGVQRSSFKFTRDIEVSGVDSSTTLTSPIIVEVKFSIPVGALDAEVLIQRQKAIALLDSDTIMNKLNLLLVT